MSTEDLVQVVFEYDPTQDACLETGRDMSDPATAKLALFKIHEDALFKRKLMEERNDTYRSMPYTRYLSIAESLGFKKIYEITLKRNNKDRFIIMWHSDGLLLRFDTYNQEINRSVLYFNWQGTEENFHPSGGFFGGWVADPHIYAGYYHVDVGLRYHVNLLYKKGGRPLIKWVADPGLYLVNWQDSRESKKITLMRIKKLPEEIQKAVGFGSLKCMKGS